MGTNNQEDLLLELNQSHDLKRSLGPLMIWGLGVGYVISGMYFGWNLGLISGGPVGMLVATLLVTVMYVAFIYCYAELATMMPRAGGAFYYADTIVGPKTGLIAGFAQSCEFIFAPPAIAYAIGAYFSLFFEGASPLVIAIIAYVIFTAINIYGVTLSAGLELFLTIFAVVEIIIFVGATAPHFSMENFLQEPLPNGIYGIFLSIPFAMWFYLGLEGIANIAEEARRPERDLALGFKSAMATLALMALLVLLCAVGVDGWQAVVYPAGSEVASDSPLPLALAKIVGDNGILYHLLITVGLFGLIASFHGIILASGRTTMELGRAGILPPLFGKTLKKQKTPAAALLANMVIGILALFTGRTGDIIMLSVLGAIVLYLVSIFVFMRARKTERHVKRIFKAPFYPLTPAIAGIIALIALITVMVAHQTVSLLFLSGLALIFALNLKNSSLSKNFSLGGKNRRGE